MLFTKRIFFLGGGMKAINWGSVFQITKAEVRNLREKIQIIHTMRDFSLPSLRLFYFTY